MIAIPRPRFWTPTFDPLALFALNGKRLMRLGRRQMRNGKRIMGTDCCLYQARDCNTNTLQPIYVKKSQFPSFPSTYYFSQGGTCYYVQSSDKAACSNTPNLSGATTFASCAACTGGGGAPCTCNYPTGLSATYTVSGWGSLAACSTCDASGDPAWDGTLNHIGSGCVWWAADAAFDLLSINGASLDITYTQLLLRTDVTPCRWELYIACSSATLPTKTMWSGYKTTGATPAGTFSFVSSDCGNTTPTMTVA